jgi:two-component system, cell cycle response regulator
VKLLSIKQVIFRIVVIHFMLEWLIMLFFAAIPPLQTYVEAALDPTLLTIFSTPAMYFWVIKPFVDARDSALSQVSHLAHTDSLTQVANRRLVVTQLEKFIAESIRHKDHSAVLLLDLDGFKKINDKYGHDAGDAILVEVAKRLTILIRSEDMVGRIGGDEFIVLISRLGTSERAACNKAEQIAKKLIALICMPFEFQGTTLNVGVSIGVCPLGQAFLNTETAIRDADIAMFQAKKAGGNQVVIFENVKTAQLF